MLELFGAFILIVVGYLLGAVKIIQQGDTAIVERLGKAQRVLQPGPNLIIPFFDTVLVETMREQLLDIEPQNAITTDSVPISVDTVVFWQIRDIEKAYYEVEDLEESLKQLVFTSLRNEIGQLTLEQVVSQRNDINQTLLSQLDQATQNWGVKVIRVEVQDIILSDTIRESLEKQRAAVSEKQATLARTSATVQSIEQLARALQGQTNSEEVLRYLIARDYVNANLELGKSDNSKILFMNPGALNEAITDLLQQQQHGDNISPNGSGDTNIN
ncbi:SPFH domain-containing protein [Myxacorys almedinensis]|uniref:Paraslipin n=1 Tax=Myxacorys almedinensis A TaxID=2690445 RepID=A0A8J8CKC7_9CYAN|nr:stomatin-like protein [Myxacorys almedinensis]NDJ18471.1 paraslipin [Myxacorys almedinensis A]